jgi:O-antigen/teichoic acid export membrane protein
MGIIKKVFGASAIIILANGLNRLFAILSAPVLTRALGPAPYGIMALIGTVTSMASTLSLLGIDMSYARFYFSKTNTTSHAVEKFCWRYAILSSIIIGILTSFFWQVLWGKSNNNFMIALIVGLTTLLFVINTMSQTRARLRDEYNRMGLAIIVSGISATLISISLALVWRRDEWPLLIGFVFGILINVIIIGIPKSNLLLNKSGLTVKEKWPIIKLGLPGLITATMYWVLSSSDRWFLNYFWGKKVVGIYSFAYNVAIIGLVVNTAILLTWIPESIKTYEENTDSASSLLGEVWGGLALSLSLIWLMVASIGGDIIRFLADSQFHPGAVYIPWIAGGVFFYGIASLANTGLLISKNMKPAAFWWVIGALVNLISNYFFIQSWGAFGAAITNCLSFGFISVGVMWNSSKLFKLNIPWKRLLIAGAFVLVMGLITNSSWHRYPALSICLKLPVCLVVSFLTAWFILPEWIKKVVSRLDRLISEVKS